MSQYRYLYDPTVLDGEEPRIREDAIQEEATGAYIPFDPDNFDYKDYLVWLNDGNTPLPPINYDQSDPSITL